MKIEIPYEYTNLRKISKGLTNDNYLAEIDNKTYIIRYPKDDTKHLFDRSSEQEIINQLKEMPYILPSLYYKDGIQVSLYKDDLLNFDEYNSSDKIIKVASLMKQFHKSNITVDHNFNPLKQAKIYYDNLVEKPFSLSKYSDLFTQYDNYDFTPILCHNDWVNGNICYVENNTYLIDFEYAGMNDKYFDIMSFTTENDLSNADKKAFINEMLEYNITEKDIQILEMYRDINNLLWYLWALMMYQFRAEEIYLLIANDKLKALQSEYQKPLDFI